MARNQKNFRYFAYVDDNGATWNVRGEDGGAAAAVDGHAAFDAAAPVWTNNSRRHHVRYAVYQDTVTLRTVKAIIYTPTAFAAIAPGDIVAVQVPGLATTVNYTLRAKIAEKLPLAGPSRQLADT